MFKALLNFEKRGKIQIKPVFTLCQTLYWQSESSVKIQGFPKSMWYPKLDPKTEKKRGGGNISGCTDEIQRVYSSIINTELAKSFFKFFQKLLQKNLN